MLVGVTLFVLNSLSYLLKCLLQLLRLIMERFLERFVLQSISCSNADMKVLQYTRFLYKQHFYEQRQVEISKKIKRDLSNTMRLNFCYLKIFRFLHPHYRPGCAGGGCVCLGGVVWLVAVGVGLGMGVGHVGAAWVGLRWLAGYLGLALFFGWDGALRGKFHVCCSRVFCQCQPGFHFGGGGWGLGYHSMGFGHFPDIS